MTEEHFTARFQTRDSEASIDPETLAELKQLKADDTKKYPKAEFKLVWDNDIRQDRTGGWE